MLSLSTDDPLAASIVAAIQSGDVAVVGQLLDKHPGLATARVFLRAGDYTCAESRTLLHIATDWPGHFPHGAVVVAALVAAGADVNAPFEGHHGETPLHWAASCDDVTVLDALVQAGANLEATGGVIGDGTPLADAVAFGQWKAARRLLEHGAQATLWQAAALGLMDRLAACCARDPAPTAEELTNAFWCACHGGQQPAAAELLARGAELNWIGHDQLTPLAAACRSGATSLADWLVARGAVTASSVPSQ